MRNVTLAILIAYRAKAQARVRRIRIERHRVGVLPSRVLRAFSTPWQVSRTGHAG